ncbi:transcriptional regulator [Serratia liquefaciens]|jgi:hypothetical protein|uniref:transcriptional regulator n=1 Tax=Serratia liquefaciens TaxID=614 RepID=UPI0039059415
MKLKDYLEVNHVTQQDFSAATGLTQGFISRVVNGFYVPGSKATRKIAVATGYAVTPHDLNPNIYPNPTDGLPQEPDGSTAAA